MTRFFDSYSLIIAVVLMAALIISVISFYEHLEKKRKETVTRFSQKYHEICSINQKYDFRECGKHLYVIESYLNSKQSLERADINEIAAYLISNEADLRKMIQIIQYNRERFRDYREEIKRVEDTTITSISSSGVDISDFLQIEKEICDAAIKHPQLGLDIKVCLRYVSSKGSSYERSIAFNYVDALRIIYKYPKKELIRTQARLERAKMNDAIRYEVMKRDGFRCVICGATAQDGVKLHVDHIFPVSKGGKTEMSNLRTLCERCNLGKKDKYDYNGLN